jgi:LmbE family N-acetylglucosaminyl deacetylase
VLSLTLGAPVKRRLEFLFVGAHCDDIEIGCGGTVMTLQKRYPGCRIHWLVLTSGANRLSEGEAALRSFVLPATRGEVRFCNLPDGLLPTHLQQVKSQFEELRATIDPDLVFTHHGADRHQDHSLVSQVTWQTFRDHTILEYEIPKYDGDLSTPNVYVPLAPLTAARKIELILRLFPSQQKKPWFKAQSFEAMAHLRGLESRAPSGLAEAFHCRKLTLSLAPPDGQRTRRRSKRK